MKFSTMRRLFLLACACFAFQIPGDLSAQAEPQGKKISERYNAMWNRGLESCRAGETALLAGRNEEAAENYKKALELFQSVRKKYPNWNKTVVNYRISLASKRLNTAMRRLSFRSAEEKKAQDQTAALEAAPAKNPENPQEEIADLRAALLTLRNQFGQVRKDAERGKAAQERLESILKEKTELDAKYAALMLQYNELKKQSEAAANGNSELEKAFRAEKFRTDALTRVVDDLRKENESLRKTSDALAEEKKGLLKTAQDTDKLAESVARYEKLLSEAQQQLKNAKDAASEAAASAAKENAELAKKLADKNDECKNLTAKLNSARTESQAETAKKHEAELAAVRREGEAFKNQASKLKDTLLEKDKALVEASDRELKQNSFIKSLDSSVNDLTAKLKKNELLLKEKTAEAEESKKSLAEATGKLEKLTAEVKTLADRVNKLPANGIAADSEKIKLETQYKALSLDYEKIKKELDALKAKPAPAPVKVENPLNKTLEAKVKALETELADLKKKPAPAPVKVENPLNTTLEAKVKALEAELADLKKRPAPAPVKVENPLNHELSAKVKTQEAELDNLKKKLVNSASSEATLKTKVGMLEKEVAALQDTLHKTAQDAPAASKAEIETLLAKNRTLTENIAALTTALAAAQEEKNKYGDANLKLSKDLLNTQALLEKTKLETQDDSKLKAARTEAGEWKTKVDALQKSLDEANAGIAAGKTDADGLRARITALETERTELRKKAVSAETQLEDWKNNRNLVSKSELDEKAAALDELLKDQVRLNSEIAGLKKQSMLQEAQLARFRKNMQMARTVTEKAMTESRQLRAELITYRRNDPNRRMETPVAITEIPQEMKELSQEKNETKTRAEQADTAKYEECMKAARDAETRKDYDDALWQFWAAADTAVERWEPYMEISRILVIRKDPEQGIKTYEKALRLGAARVPEIENALKAQLLEIKKKPEEKKK